MTKTIARSLILWITLLQVLNGCDTPPEEKHELSIGTSASVNASFLFYANHIRAFEQQGLQAKITKYPSAALAFHDMLDGKIDIAGVAETPLAFASLDRDDFSIFATLCSMGNDPKIIARRVNGISSPGDLIGKRIGTTKQGQSAHFFLQLFLAKHHISFNQVTTVHDSPGNIVDRLIKGELDAASLFEPYLAQAAAALADKGVIFQEPGLYYKTFNLVALRSTLQHDPELIERFIQGLLAGEKSLKKDQEKAVSYLSKELNTAPDIIRNYFKAADFTIFLSNATALTILDEARWAQDNRYITSPKLTVPSIQTLFYDNALRKFAPERVTIPGD